MNILECSSRGNKKFSALYAKVNVFGKTDTIENHYQSCKKFNTYIGNSKGKYPDYIILGKLKLSPEYLSQYYDILWIIYLDEHPKLVEYAKQFDDFSDMFKSKNSICCQADTIRKYVKGGRKSLIKECKDLLNIFIDEGIVKSKKKLGGK